MEAEVEQLKSLVEDLFMRIESLENRVSELESEGAKPAGPEPLLTCVQCQSEYKESENAEGHCKYHSDILRYGSWKATYKCCNKSANDRLAAMSLPGCTKGKHRSKHHTDYVYSHYYFYMMDLSNNAKEVWLQADLKDLVTDSCKWAEVGLSNEGKVFVVFGTTRVQPVAFVELSMRELKQCKKSVCVLIEKEDPAGWCLRAELCAMGCIANSISVSLKVGGYKSPLVKRLGLVVTGETFRPGTMETLSDPTPPNDAKVSVEDVSTEEVREGPALEPGQDLSTDRKSDYPTVTNDDMFTLELQQTGSVRVSSSFRTASGKWNNFFEVDITLSCGLSDSVSITKVFGEYLSEGDEWVKCDGVRVRPTDGREFLDRVDFLVGGVAPLSMTFQLAIGIDGPEPDSWALRSRAHHSLPQPLHLRLTCVDVLNRTASLRVEQGNPPLSLPTCESRIKSWTKGGPLLFYIFADNVNTYKRSDIAIYHDENGMTVFRPAPEDNPSHSFFLREDMLTKAAYQALSSNVSEVELTNVQRECSGCAVKAFALIDQQVVYALKVLVTTPTSKTQGVYILPPKDDFSTASLSVSCSEVTVNSNFVVSWKVPRASKNDRIELFSRYGKKGLSRSYNKRAQLQGSCEMKAPLTPGQCELRYYPAWLAGTYTGLRHDISVVMATLTIIAA